MRVEARSIHILFVLYVAGVFVLMFAPVPGSAPDVPQFDKLVHIAVFFLFAALLHWDRSVTPGARTTGVILMTSAAAGLVELIQIVLPYRTGSLLDFLVGVIGAIGGVVVMRQLVRTTLTP